MSIWRSGLCHDGSCLESGEDVVDSGTESNNCGAGTWETAYRPGLEMERWNNFEKWFPVDSTVWRSVSEVPQKAINS